MLLRFAVENYKNFAHELTFSMKPDRTQKGLSWSIQKEETKEGEFKALSSAVVFGPNASGKSNIIGAVDTFKRIALRGNLRRERGAKADPANHAATDLELVPNRYLAESRPVSFAAEFIDEGIRFEYSFKADLGCFGESDYPRRALAEELLVDGEKIFVRSGRNSFSFGNLKGVSDEVWGSPAENREKRARLASEMTAPDELFLMNGFRTSVSRGLADRIENWLSKRLIIARNWQNLEFGPRPQQLYADGLAFAKDEKLTKALARITPNADMAGHVFDSHDDGLLCVGVNSRQGPRLFQAACYESCGTVRLLNLLPIFEGALENGAALLVDEFDASLHPYVAQGVVSAFHNDEINRKQAQLIVNTHNIIHMSGDLFRRDEIHFLDPNWDDHTVDHYTLADFKASGSDGVQRNEDYMRKYLRGAFGAVPSCDIGELLRTLTREAP